MRAVAILQHQENSATTGGAATAGSWEDRKLTNEISDLNNMVSLAALTGIMTIQPGTYFFDFRLPHYGIGHALTRLVNAATGAVLLSGSGLYSPPNSSANQIDSRIIGIVTFSAVTTIKLQSNVESSQANGYGFATSLGTEIYTTGSISVLG